MSEDGAKLCNVAVLADEARTVRLEVPIARLERIAEHLTRREGVVSGTVMLTRDGTRIVADVAMAVQLWMQCQRCLQPLPVPVESSSRVVLLESEAQAGSVPPEQETVLAPEGRMRLADLVEEELLLALPAAPRHADGQCPAGGTGRAVEDFGATSQRPFADLDALLSGRSKQ